MPMCIYAVGVYTYGICVEDVYRVCLRILWDVYVWSIGVRYIYLISMFYNAVDTVIYI